MPHVAIHEKRIAPCDDVSRKNSASLLASVGGTVLSHWCQWVEMFPIVALSGKNSVPLLLLLEIIGLHCQGGSLGTTALDRKDLHCE